MYVYVYTHVMYVCMYVCMYVKVWSAIKFQTFEVLEDQTAIHVPPEGS